MRDATWFAPTREAILECLRAADVPMTPHELAERLAVPSTHFENLNRRLLAMERDGQLLPNRKGVLLLASKLDLVAGRVQGHRDGFGFLIPDEGGVDVFLSPREMQKVMHGDRVLVKRTGFDARGRPEGRIVEVTERANRRIVGRFLNERGVDLVVPEDQRIKHDIVIPAGETQRAQQGQVVTVEIIEPPAGGSPPIGRVVEVLGEIDDPGMEIEIAVRKFDVPYTFSDAALERAASLPNAVRTVDLKGRVDLRDVPLVTIDGEDARDFDDAVYCEPMPGSGRREGAFRLIVAIADVSHYVEDGDPIDRDALERSTSVYFPRRVIPMLPEKLSNGLCSLNPNVDRLVLVCDMVIERSGRVRGYQFYEAVMHSAARLTYDEVWALLSGGAAALSVPPGHAALAPQLRNLHELYLVLAAARRARGAIDFETVETKIVCDPAGRIERIVPTQRNDAHKLIEECMLAANVCAADWMRRSRHGGLYRVHEGPVPEKLAQLREFLRSFGLTLGGGDDPAPSDYAVLAEQVRARPDAILLQTMLLRSMQQAVYSPDNVGHFGLAYEAYAHFTSPIRRYPDLLTHRVIKALLRGERYRPAPDAGQLREVLRARPPGADDDLVEPDIDDEGAILGLTFDARRPHDAALPEGLVRTAASDGAAAGRGRGGGAAADDGAAGTDAAAKRSGTTKRATRAEARAASASGRAASRTSARAAGAAAVEARREHETWRLLGTLCSLHERRADEASRDVAAWLKCMYVRERVGEVFVGHVTGVAPFGIFVTLDELYVEGLVHVSELGSEYFQYNEVAHELRGERTGKRFRLTDELEVQVSRVDLEARRIDFRLVDRLGFRELQRGREARDADAPPALPKAAPAKSEKVKQVRAERAAARRKTPAAPAAPAKKRRTGLRRRH
ncbi:MAG TPA: ribonuclease R [Zeimonas sp.]|nr:ribonuclease R [Zeimonas sp.]